MANTAIVTYFHNSGFTVAVGKTLLVFDYWRGENDALPEAARLTNADFAAYEQVLVFVSHDHEDHFDEVIYTWDYEHLPITYIVADDLPIGKRGKRMKPGEKLTVCGPDGTEYLCAAEHFTAGEVSLAILSRAPSANEPCIWNIDLKNPLCSSFCSKKVSENPLSFAARLSNSRS